jgi:ABC-type transport system involved in multi-copper enzyme maturation permease subunit
MYLLENPVLQRELLVNLRMKRSFALLFLYLAALSTVVYFAWPADTRVDPTRQQSGRQLIDLFFSGQYLLASLIAPSFAAGAITGEKERKTYEMLLASPLRPAAIVLGKLLASLTHVAALIFASLPIVMLCLPLGGVSLYEVLAASVATYGMISVACSSYFKRTAASLVVSYLVILPLSIFGVAIWFMLADSQAWLRLMMTVTLLPAVAATICYLLFINTNERLLHPPDVGSEGQEVVDLEQEAQQAVGLVINRDQFPDRLFAPAKRDDLMDDGANPVYDKEVRSEIFSQGTLMLRVVIQVSMILAIPIMACCLYIWSHYTPVYVSYVLLFNLLVGPVFSAGSMTSERERETLDLLLTTVISPWQIMWGKLVAGLRISSVLTMFLVWPIVLAALLVPFYWKNFPAVVAYLGIILLTCMSTAVVALFCSAVFRKTAVSMITAYAVIAALFFGPWATRYLTGVFGSTAAATKATAAAPSAGTSTAGRGNDAARDGVSAGGVSTRGRLAGNAVAGGASNGSASNGSASNGSATNGGDANGKASPGGMSGGGTAVGGTLAGRAWTGWVSIFSPFAIAFEVPLFPEDYVLGESPTVQGDWLLFFSYLAFTLLLNAALLAGMVWLFRSRWRVSGDAR